MRTSYKIIFLFILSSIHILQAQEKIKGNKDVTFEDRNLSNFTKIQVIDDFDVFLAYNENQSVNVETDSNLQKMIITDVKNGVLTIKENGNIGRYKTLKIHLKINKDLQEILTYNKATITAKNTLVIDSLTISSFDDSEIDLKLNSDKLTFDGKNNSDLNLEILSASVSGRLEDKCDFKGTINTKDMQLYMADKSTVSVTGTSYNFNIESYGSATFKGSNFATNNTMVKAYNNSTVFINAAENLELYSNNDSEVYIYSTPKIVLQEFYDNASIQKKELN